ncbi:hypothetical protein ONZ45_g13370 [Pleurotus djamor]|nr:hypothetical protein ONZ45_g13370 [Pleurotus djamor]
MLTSDTHTHDWRAPRRALWQEFGPSNSGHHVDVQLEHRRELLQKLMDEPEAFLQHIYRSFNSTATEITYGSKMFIGDCAQTKYTQGHMPSHGFQSTSWTINRITSLLGLSTSSTGVLAHAAYNKTSEMISEQSLESHPCFISRARQRNEKLSPEAQVSEDILKNVASMACDVTTEVMPVVVDLFLTAMASHPQARLKAQVELDAYLRGRLPIFEDQPFLPYVHAVMLETLRWRPLFPLAVLNHAGMAHTVTRDDQYQEYRITKSASIFANVWAILHDESTFPDPDEFKPERFFKDGNIDTKLEEIVEHATYGFGRRMCPGRHFASRSLWLYISSILTTFSMSQKTTERGALVTCMVPRSGQAKEQMQDQSFSLAEPLEFD